jgi:integrase
MNRSEAQRLLDALVCLPRDELGRLTGPSNPWVRLLIIVAIETAMRRSELLALRWEHVELDLSFARLLDAKNGEVRDVPLSSRAVERTGIKDLHFHDLRHEATSRLAERLSNVLELSAVPGRKTLPMLKRYYHPKAEELAQKLG